MGNSFAHAVNVTLPEPHGQETFPSYRLSKPVIIKHNSSKNVPPMGQADHLIPDLLIPYNEREISKVSPDLFNK